MGRPIGSKDRKKRGKKYAINRKTKNLINNLFSSGLNYSQIQEKMNHEFTHAQIKGAKEKPDLNINHVSYELTEFKKDICGVYTIGLFQIGKRAKWYIGSSVNICERIRSHISTLKKNKHYNKELQQEFNRVYSNKNSKYKLFVLQECAESELYTNENKLIKRFCQGCLLNKWFTDKEEFRPFYDKAAKYFNPDRYTIENDCWIWKTTKRSYGRPIAVTIYDDKKEIPPHRLSYYIEHGEIPDIVRHQCENKRCVNPKHLKNGSYSDNAKDIQNSPKYKEDMKNNREEFEQLWLQYRGDKNLITDNSRFSVYMYYKLKSQLKLSTKYPEIEEERRRKNQQKRSEGSRGPKREKLKDKIINNWKCIEEWVAERSHKWECMQCGCTRQTAKYTINKYSDCKRCNAKKRAIEILSDLTASDIEEIKKSGLWVGQYPFRYEELI